MFKADWLQKSVVCALENGYEAVPNLDAFDNHVYIKNDMKWIHEITLLKLKLNIEKDEELVQLGYNVNDFYQYNTDNFPQYAKEIIRRELLDIFNDEIKEYPDSRIYIGDGIYIDEDGNLDGDWNR